MAVKKEEGEGPDGFIASFTHLKYLCLKYYDYVYHSTSHFCQDDFPPLFARNKGLETIKVNGKVDYQCTRDALEDPSLNDVALTTLNLMVTSMDILCLKFITQNLKKIETSLF